MSRPLTDNERRYAGMLLRRKRGGYVFMFALFVLVLGILPVSVLVAGVQGRLPPIVLRSVGDTIELVVVGMVLLALCLVPLIIFFDLAFRRLRLGPVQILEGEFRSRVDSNSESIVMIDTIGKDEVTIPAHWRQQLREGQVAVAEVCYPLPAAKSDGPGRAGDPVVLAIEGGPSIEREVSAGLLRLPGAAITLVLVMTAISGLCLLVFGLRVGLLGLGIAIVAAAALAWRFRRTRRVLAALRSRAPSGG